MIECNAAVLWEKGGPVRIERVRLAALGPRDVLVRIRGSGLCHSDIELIDGSIAGYPLPLVIGHEGAGVVEEVGSEVRDVAVGDHVVCSFNPHCGHCFYCERGLPSVCEVFDRQRGRGSLLDGEPRLSVDGRPVHHFSFVSAHAEYAVISDLSAVKIPAEVPFDVASIIGCGVMTGVGAVLQVARIEVGSVVAVIGCGIVGLSAIQGAAIAGAETIIGIDPQPARREAAAQLGAHITVWGAQGDILEQVRAATRGRGADCVFEAAGSEPAFRLAAEAVRPGGQVVFLGKVAGNQDVSFRWGSLMREKRFVRTSAGGARPREFFPWLAPATWTAASGWMR